MKTTPITRLSLATAAALLGLGLAADAAPGDGQGWTGITNPKDVINAREELMEEIEHVMEPIDTFEVEDVPDLNQLRLAANTVHVMLLALPHLFPPTTNLYDPKAETPATLALPGIWKDFPTFYALAGAAADAAEAMAENRGGKDQLRAAAKRIRVSCDACHTLFLRPYVASKVQQSDIDFDFDSVFKKKK